jgi:hypothetical protein
VSKMQNIFYNDGTILFAIIFIMQAMIKKRTGRPQQKFQNLKKCKTAEFMAVESLLKLMELLFFTSPSFRFKLIVEKDN